MPSKKRPRKDESEQPDTSPSSAKKPALSDKDENMSLSNRSEDTDMTDANADVAMTDAQLPKSKPEKEEKTLPSSNHSANANVANSSISADVKMTDVKSDEDYHFNRFTNYLRTDGKNSALNDEKSQTLIIEALCECVKNNILDKFRIILGLLLNHYERQKINGCIELKKYFYHKIVGADGKKFEHSHKILYTIITYSRLPFLELIHKTLNIDECDIRELILIIDFFNKQNIITKYQFDSINKALSYVLDKKINTYKNGFRIDILDPKIKEWFLEKFSVKTKKDIDFKDLESDMKKLLDDNQNNKAYEILPHLFKTMLDTIINNDKSVNPYNILTLCTNLIRSDKIDEKSTVKDLTSKRIVLSTLLEHNEVMSSLLQKESVKPYHYEHGISQETMNFILFSLKISDKKQKNTILTIIKKIIESRNLNLSNIIYIISPYFFNITYSENIKLYYSHNHPSIKKYNFFDLFQLLFKTIGVLDEYERFFLENYRSVYEISREIFLKNEINEEKNSNNKKNIAEARQTRAREIQEDKQTTHTSSIHKSARASIIKLCNRYNKPEKNITNSNELDKFTQILPEIKHALNKRISAIVSNKIKDEQKDNLIAATSLLCRLNTTNRRHHHFTTSKKVPTILKKLWHDSYSTTHRFITYTLPAHIINEQKNHANQPNPRVITLDLLIRITWLAIHDTEFFDVTKHNDLEDNFFLSIATAQREYNTDDLIQTMQDKPACIDGIFHALLDMLSNANHPDVSIVKISGRTIPVDLGRFYSDIFDSLPVDKKDAIFRKIQKTFGLPNHIFAINKENDLDPTEAYKKVLANIPQNIREKILYNVQNNIELNSTFVTEFKLTKEIISYLTTEIRKSGYLPKEFMLEHKEKFYNLKEIKSAIPEYIQKESIEAFFPSEENDDLTLPVSFCYKIYSYQPSVSSLAHKFTEWENNFYQPTSNIPLKASLQRFQYLCKTETNTTNNHFFASVKRQLTLHDTDSKYTTEQIRDDVIREFESHFNSYYHQVQTGGITPHKFLEDALATNTWTDDLIIEALCRVLNINIYYLNSSNNRFTEFHYSSQGKNIYLGYDNENKQYVSLEKLHPTVTSLEKVITFHKIIVNKLTAPAVAPEASLSTQESVQTNRMKR